MSIVNATKKFLVLSGAPQVAKGAVDALDAMRAKTLGVAESLGASKAQLKRIAAAMNRGESAQSALAIVFPFVPSPAVLRKLARVGDSAEQVRSRRRS